MSLKYILPMVAGVCAVIGSVDTAKADEIKILAGNLPPMIMDSGEGREAEVIKHVLESCGHTVTFSIQPFTRHWASYEAGEADAVTTVPVGMPMPGTQTKAYVYYQNGTSSLESAGAVYENLDSLSGRSVVAFMTASNILPGLSEAVPTFSSYREIADQIGQSRMIFGGRTDVVIGDGMIFAEFNRELREGSEALNFDPNQQVVFQAIFEPTQYAMNFRNPDYAADFDRCLDQAEADGSIAAINTAWADRYRAELGSNYMGY